MSQKRRSGPIATILVGLGLTAAGVYMTWSASSSAASESPRSAEAAAPPGGAASRLTKTPGPAAKAKPVNKTGAGIPVAAASPGGSIAPPAANRLPYQLRFEGRIYRAVYERQMDEGRPIDVYFFPMRLADGSQPLQDGSPLFGRFVRIPAASDPDQSRVEWAAAWWVLRNGRWEIAARRPAQVELLGRNE